MNETASLSSNRLIDASELAEHLGMSRRWLYMQVESHDLPAYKLGRSLAFDIRAVERWLERKRVGDWYPDNCETHILNDLI